MNNRAIWVSFFLIMVALVPSLSQAQTWKFLLADDNDALDIDTASIKSNAKQRKLITYRTRWNVSVLTSTDSHAADNDRSSVSDGQIDCGQAKVRNLKTQYYSQHYARGPIVESDLNAGNWERIAPDSPDATIKAFLCDGAAPATSPESYDPNSTTVNKTEHKSEPKVSARFTESYKRALKAAGNNASSLKAGQQEWWKEREQKCKAVSSEQYDRCMRKEEEERRKILDSVNPTAADISTGRKLLIPIKLGQTYLQVRKALLNAGWKTSPSHQAPGGSSTCFEDTYEGNPACKFEEIEDCSGSGVGYCAMSFEAKGTGLRIITTGGPPPDAKIDSWSTFSLGEI